MKWCSVSAIGVALLLTMCSPKPSESSDADLVVLDVKQLQSLPVEEFDFATNPAIASVEYFQPHDTIIFPFGLPIIGDSWVAIWHDFALVFDLKSGRALSFFDRHGQGPEEYVSMAGLAVDTKAQTCNVVTSDFPTKIKTYSFGGDYLGEIVIPDKIYTGSQTFKLLNDSCYFVEQSSIRRVLSGKTDDPLDARPYLLINRRTGDVTQLPVERWDPKICERYVPKVTDGYTWNYKVSITNVHGGEDGIIISEFSNDTIFALRDEHVEPIAVKKNWSKDYDEPDLLSVLYSGSRYMIFELVRKRTNHSAETVDVNQSKSGTFVYDREKNEFHRYNNPEWFESNGHFYALTPVYKLMDDAESGVITDSRLLDIVNKSNIESNFVWTLYNIAR
ncbi:MAG: 6-bladed beta-propeller [Muribaculaceae bacterium]|nr:6-bladed beta-propeller [Muribaculaceae bacterium]